MIIAVASGKGGTGKTTVATSLALSLLDDRSPHRGAVRFLDCDVEEPNAALFLHPTFDRREEVVLLVPVVDASLCTLCGRCAEVCAYHAIVVAGKKVLVFPQMCHGCGSCSIQCPVAAIQETAHLLGAVESGRAGPLYFARGVLEVGQALSVPVIRQLKRDHLEGCAGSATEIAILDAPPGTSCPVVQTMRGADFVLLVTEPTPFGLHDLSLAVEVARDELGLPVGVVINRDGCGDSGVDEFCAREGIPVLMRIPLDLRIAQAIARGDALIRAFPEYRTRFHQLFLAIVAKVVL